MVASHILSSLSYMSAGLVKGWSWRWMYLGISGLTVKFSVSAVPSGPSIDIWRSCSFLGALLGALSGFTWWSRQVLALPHWCSSLSTSVYLMGTVWSWAHF